MKLCGRIGRTYLVLLSCLAVRWALLLTENYRYTNQSKIRRTNTKARTARKRRDNSTVDSNSSTLSAATTNGIENETPSYGHNNSTFCVDWNTDMDSWWTHHPEWESSFENDTHYCFSYIQDSEKAAFYRKLYDIQFHGNCSNVTTKEMWSSGWSADFLNVNDAIRYAMETRQPVQMYVPKGLAWHYAATKDGSQPVCPEKDMFCFFLNITSCDPVPEKCVNELFMESWDDIDVLQSNLAGWAYEYATRPQTWLRREVYDYTSSFKLTTPCSVMHVRRTDVVLANDGSRKYHAIQEYIDGAKSYNISRNIFLLTDDQNAITEATLQFPQYNWMYLDRARHRGAEGGWENQIPSGDPKLEVVILLSIFRLIKQCDTLIHSTSGFADQLLFEMRDPLRIDLDYGMDYDDVHNETFASTVNISKSSW